MAWTKNKFGSQMAAFEKMPNSIGNMHAPAAMLHDKTLMPTKGNGPGLGNPTAGALGGDPLGKSVQSPAQHAAVKKAASVSAARRKKII